VTLVDTAGLEEAAPETLAGRMRASSASAVATADLVVFVVDARPASPRPTSISPPGCDARPARSGGGQQGRGQDRRQCGVGSVFARAGRAAGGSAEHGEGLADLMREIADRLPAESEQVAEADRP